MLFDSFELDRRLLRAIDHIGWDMPTPDGFGIDDDGDEFRGASVEELIREEEEMDELFDV